MTVNIYRAPSLTDASQVLNALYEEYRLAKFRTKTSDWFTAEADGYSVFYWKPGVWMFGVEAENSDTRNQAATELVQHLRGSINDEKYHFFIIIIRCMIDVTEKLRDDLEAQIRTFNFLKFG
ncbi:MAG: hypothetical protein NZ932_00330 [Candidatus Bathyarchaeota archaeon]|nr:hypothetical protein [Candidatus Bathyarchaeota archaeon]MDW8040812.1 hypothetical protein [Nitrososphaerota archaeon]